MIQIDLVKKIVHQDGFHAERRAADGEQTHAAPKVAHGYLSAFAVEHQLDMKGDPFYIFKLLVNQSRRIFVGD